MNDAFALENFAPAETVKFRLSKHGEHEFAVDADPDTGDVALMLKVEEKIGSAESDYRDEPDGTRTLVKSAEAKVMEAATEGKEVLLRLIQERQPEVTKIRAGMQEILIIFSLIMRGSSVAAAVARAIVAPASTEEEPLEPGDEPSALREGDGGAPEATVTPLPSAKPSSDPSSSSATEDAGLPATGTA